MYNRLVRVVIKLLTVSMVAVILQECASRAAYMERGYFAFGGEVFIFPAVMYIGYYITGVARDLAIMKRHQKRSHTDKTTN